MRRCGVPGRADETKPHVTIVRDPLWNNIPLDADAMRLVDTAVFQRLRYVRQLGLAFLVYPGATHSRFEHALGTYHLTGRTLALLRERGELAQLPADECAVVRAAALLHDVGHYPFSHALEEIGALHHEAVARTLITGGEIASVLASTIGANAAMRAHAIITGESASPLQGLISGSLDLDKIEYLKRDALMCGVPYGEIDVERLLHSLTIVEDPKSGAPAIGLVEKGLAALESLLFAKYQMYRNVYWHHAVRSATAMYKRLVDDALRSGAIEERELAGFTDEGLAPRARGARAVRAARRAPQSPPAQARLRVLVHRAHWRPGRLDRGRSRARDRGGGCARARARRRAGRGAARLSREAADAGARSSRCGCGEERCGGWGRAGGRRRLTCRCCRRSCTSRRG